MNKKVDIEEVEPEPINNMALWDRVKRPPVEALKTIKGGRLKGMSDINPQWRYQAMTECFGQCGVGWKYEIVDTWTKDGANGSVMVFARVNLWVNLGGIFSNAITGIGGSMLISKESSGLHSNDEAYKMAVTDALGTAMKMLGVAADIYAGLWDGSKYKEPIKKGNGTHTPVDGAVEELSEKDQLRVKNISSSIVDLFAEEKPIEAYELLHENDLSNEVQLGVWALLKPHSAIRRELKEMKDANTH